MQHPQRDERVEFFDGTYKICEGRREVLQQDFNWHDAGTSAYEFGKDGYLVMDGIQSNQSIRCLRRFKQTIGSSDEAIELCLRVVIGKRYFVRLYDGNEQMVVNCCIDTDGWVKFIKTNAAIPGAGDVNSDAYLTWGYGYPSVDPAFAAGYTVESDLHVLRFANFDFDGGLFDFWFDERKIGTVAAFVHSSVNIRTLELSSVPVPGGSGSTGRIRLLRYVQYDRSQVVEEEHFPVYWQPVPAARTGYPTDKFHDTQIRPVDHHWLETCSPYGWVKARLPCRVTAGELSFDLMSNDVSQETVVVLMEYDETADVGEWFEFGIFRSRFCAEYSTGRHSDVLGRQCRRGILHQFTDPLPQSGNIHRFRAVWSPAGTYRIWVDKVPLRFTSETYDIPFTPLRNKPFTGVNCVSFHYGKGGARGSDFTRCRYGRLRLTATEWLQRSDDEFI